MKRRSGVRAALLFVPLALFAVSGRAAAGREEPRLSRAVARCTRQAELIACDEALSLKPNDPDLLVAEGDALVQMRRPGEAIGVYRNALRLAARPDVVNPKVAAAQSQRGEYLAICMARLGTLAERACESAWLPGAPDEVALFKRRGLLLRLDNQPAAALDAYMAAARLRPADREVARSVVDLSGGPGRKDPPIWTARGSALMTLGRRSAGLACWREALRSAPDFAPAKVQLRLAERAAAIESAAQAAPSNLGGPSAVIAAEEVSGGPYSNAAPATHSN